MPDHIIQSQVSLFISPRDSDMIISVFDRLGIRRVMWRGGRGRQQVIFYVLAKDLVEIVKMIDGGTVFVTHHEFGPLDNFSMGKTMMVFSDIKLTETWVNHLAPLEYSGEFVIVHFVAKCLADWHIDGMFTLSTRLHANTKFDVGQET
jgi:hypothetical protein